MIAKAPLRISFAGGGTDIEPYCSEHGGVVLSVAIKKYAWAFCPTLVQKTSDLERAICEHFGIELGRLQVVNDAPHQSGLGGSAACFVAGIKAIRPELNAITLAELAFHLEREKLGVLGGKQDQYMAVIGGMNLLHFGPGMRLVASQVAYPHGLESLLLLVYVGERQTRGHDIISDQTARMNTQAFNRQRELAKEMATELRRGDLRAFGQLMHEAWEVKCQFSPYIATPEISHFHRKCLNSGAIAGKLTGAGGGGYMLLMQDPDRQGELKHQLKKWNVEFETVKFDLRGVVCESSS